MDNNKEQDILKTFQQAMEFSKLFNNEQTNTEENAKQPEEQKTDANDNFNNMLKMMEMMQLFTKISQPQNESTQEKNVQIQFYDDEIHTPGLKSLKSAIPYLEYPNQKTIGVFVKLIELQKLLEKYSSAVVISNTETNGESDWKRGMLTAIRPHMEDEKKQKLDMLIKMIDIREIMTKMKEVRN